ncbi:MAG: class I SAM-dependent methyltransferase [Chloroflexi bacterium]|nr:class I SAM-dependent methyltransferase [Chloroflexota bacterium]
MSSTSADAPELPVPGAPLNQGFEPSLAPREGELLSLPFDQYGRMRTVQSIVRSLYAAIAPQASTPETPHFTMRLLDVGGYPGVLRHFLAGDAYNLSVLDVVPDDGSVPGYTQASGLDLPYADRSFDVVTALDTLEHIPNADRSRFLSEVMRVARYAAVLVNPIHSVQADLAEETLNEYIHWILDAQQEQLAEHRAYGLPDFEVTVAAFEEGGWRTTHFPTANLYNWLLMMIAKHYLISMRDERASAFERTLDRFYNLTFSDCDRAEPAYRGVIVAVRPEFEAVLAQISTDYPPVESDDAANGVRLQLSQLLMSIFDLKIANHESKLLRAQMERRDQHIAGMETHIALQDSAIDSMESERERIAEREKATAEYIARLEEEMRSKGEHILYLEKLLQAVQAGRVMRLTRTASRFLGRK